MVQNMNEEETSLELNAGIELQLVRGPYKGMIR